jgi:protein-S-isoprenylcysteine O-methyltransferase Ste14
MRTKRFIRQKNRAATKSLDLKDNFALVKEWEYMEKTLNSLELKVPPVVVFIAASLGVYFSPDHSSFYKHVSDYTQIIGISVFSFGVIIGILGVYTFRQDKTTVNPIDIAKATSLVTRGIFTYTRNPMYLGLSLGILGLGVFFQTHWLAIMFFVLLFGAYMTRFQIKPEERILNELFGDDYKAYMLKTRRWF